jgi:hypothetical protein
MNISSRRESWHIPRDGRDDGYRSDGSISVLSGGELTLWSSVFPSTGDRTKYEFQLTPDRPVIVGRSEGHAPPYLDLAYRPTRIVPGTGQNILHSGGRGSDMRVSRGHFMLRAVREGIVFVNGVPRRGGGLRPPLNGTRLVKPVGRALWPSEEYLIESGDGIVVQLPNGSDLRIQAERGIRDA